MPYADLHDPHAADHTVLVVSRDQAIAALMMSLIELAGFTPVACADDESATRALGRAEPSILLLDCDADAAGSDELHRRARELGTRVVLFTPSRTTREISRVAARMGLPSFALPIRPPGLERVLRAALDLPPVEPPAVAPLGDAPPAPRSPEQEVPRWQRGDGRGGDDRDRRAR